MRANKVWIVSKLTNLLSCVYRCKRNQPGVHHNYCPRAAVQGSHRPITGSGGAKHGIGAKPHKISLSPSPQRETHWSRMRGKLCGNFQIFIVSAVKIWKQCLQTASVLSPRAPTGASPLDPTRALPSPDPLGYTPKWKFLAPQMDPGAPNVVLQNIFQRVTVTWFVSFLLFRRIQHKSPIKTTPSRTEILHKIMLKHMQHIQMQWNNMRLIVIEDLVSRGGPHAVFCNGGQNLRVTPRHNCVSKSLSELAKNADCQFALQ